MPIKKSSVPRPISRPAGVNMPDLILDPFTIPPLAASNLRPEVREALDRWQTFSIGDDYDHDCRMIALEQAEHLRHLTANWPQGQLRLTAPRVLIGPDGKESVRNKRPDDFATNDVDEVLAPMEPSKSYEKSPFWIDNIEESCFDPTAIFSIDDQDIAYAIPNSFPFFDAQELIVFPSTKAVSISQLNPNEINALASLIKDRYKAMQDAGHKFVWFGMHRGQDGGGTLEHIHFQVYGSNIAPNIQANIWTNEKATGHSHHRFQTQDGDLIIERDDTRSTETYSPYTGGFPLGMGVAYTKASKTDISDGSGDPNYMHLSEMSDGEVEQWLQSVARAVDAIEKLPIQKRANGLSGYSLCFIVPPEDATRSPMTFTVNPAKLRSVPFEQFNGLENPINPTDARDILCSRLVSLDS